MNYPPCKCGNPRIGRLWDAATGWRARCDDCCRRDAATIREKALGGVEPNGHLPLPKRNLCAVCGEPATDSTGLKGQGIYNLCKTHITPALALWDELMLTYPPAP